MDSLGDKYHSREPELPGAKACPHCAGTDLRMSEGRPGKVSAYWVRCNSCAAEGPVALSQDDALALWNRRARKKKQKPQSEQGTVDSPSA